MFRWCCGHTLLQQPILGTRKLARAPWMCCYSYLTRSATCSFRMCTNTRFESANDFSSPNRTNRGPYISTLQQVKPLLFPEFKLPTIEMELTASTVISFLLCRIMFLVHIACHIFPSSHCRISRTLTHSSWQLHHPSGCHEQRISASNSTNHWHPCSQSSL